MAVCAQFKTTKLKHKCKYRQLLCHVQSQSGISLCALGIFFLANQNHVFSNLILDLPRTFLVFLGLNKAGLKQARFFALLNSLTPSLTCLTAMSILQSAKMTNGDLPPNSRDTFFKLLVAQLKYNTKFTYLWDEFSAVANR